MPFCNIPHEIDNKIPRSNQCPMSYLSNPNPSSFFISSSTPEEVERTISSFPNKSSNIDDIPNFVFRRISGIISPVISLLFNESVCVGEFPSIFKLARVVPIYKGGDRTLVNNYRPISILPFISKVFFYRLYRKKN